MFTIDFEFELEQKVSTKFGNIGFVETLGYDYGGKKYYVQISCDRGRWFRADELEVV